MERIARFYYNLPCIAGFKNGRDFQLFMVDSTVHKFNIQFATFSPLGNAVLLDQRELFGK